MTRRTMTPYALTGLLCLTLGACSDTPASDVADVSSLTDGAEAASLADVSDDPTSADAQSIQDGKPSTDDDTVGPEDVEDNDDTEGNAEDDATQDEVEDDAQSSAPDDAAEGDAAETACATIADLRAAGEGPVDLTLCEVVVTVVYESGYYVQELGGDAMNIYVGLQFNDDGSWPYAAPTVGDILTVAVSEYGSFGGHQEVLASEAPAVTGTTTLDAYFLDLSVGTAPSEELESRLVTLSGAKVDTALGDTLSVSYGDASDVQVYLSGTVQVCEGSIIDIAKAVITEYNGVHQVKVFQAKEHVTVVDDSACLAQDYNWDFEDWTASNPPEGFIKTDGADLFDVSQETTEVYGGASAARITVTSKDATELGQLWYMTLAEVDEVTLSLWVNDSDPNLKARLVLKFYDGTQEVGDDGDKYSEYSVDGAEWSQLSVTRPVPEGASQVRGYVRFYDMADFESAGSASVVIDDWNVQMGQDEPAVPVDPACSTIADLKASAEGPVDMLLCDVIVTQVYYNGFFIQQADGEATDVYLGSQLSEEGEWPYTKPVAGDVLNLTVTEYGSFNGHEEVLQSSSPVKVGETSLDAYYLDLSEGVVPEESIESRLVKLSGAKVTQVQGDVLTVDYGTATGVAVYLSGTLQVCEGAVIDVAHGVVIQYSDIYEVKVYDAPQNVIFVDTSECLGQSYNWDFEDWSAIDPPLGFVKTTNASGLSVSQESTDVYAGASAARLTLTSPNNAELGQLYYMSLTGAPEVTLSAWLLDTDPNLKARLVLKFYDGTKEVGTGDKYSAYSEDSADWTQLSVTRAVPDDAIQARGYIRLYDAGDFETVGSASLVMDDWLLAL